jgi:uncharacterized glyoxalase superfamily metalloenzyme YdcJ
VAQGWLEAAPIVYEDFLPQSAAGIFASNLSRDATVDAAATGTVLDEDWMAGVLGRPLADPTALYAAQRQASLADAAQLLGLPPIQTARPTPTTTGAPA